MSDFLEQIKSLIAEREDAEKARDASQARIDEITAELATVAEWTAQYVKPSFEPAPEPRKHRRTRSDAGVPRTLRSVEVSDITTEAPSAPKGE